MTSPKEKKDIIITNTWLTTNQIAHLADCGYQKAKKIRDLVNKQLEKNGFTIFTKTKAPTKEVLEFIGLDLDFLEMQCNKKSGCANTHTTISSIANEL